MINLLEIDLNKPQRALSEYLGHNIVLTSKVTTDGKRISISSQELKEHTGIMSKLYETITLSSDYNSVQNYDDMGEAIYFVIRFWYTFKKGRSNGTGIGAFIYIPSTGEWHSYIGEDKGKIL